ncbi:unnamed protein product [Boreogadus saida]
MAITKHNAFHKALTCLTINVDVLTTTETLCLNSAAVPEQIHKQPDTGDERSRQACKRGVPSRSSALLSTVCRAQSSAHGQCQTHAIAAGEKKQREETSDPRSRNSPRTNTGITAPRHGGDRPYGSLIRPAASGLDAPDEVRRGAAADELARRG